MCEHPLIKTHNQGQLHAHVTCAAHTQKSSRLGLMLCYHHPEILNILFEQAASHFYFALGPTKYIASSAHNEILHFVLKGK